MDNYTATEQAYKNGYEQGLKDAVKHGKWVNARELVGGFRSIWGYDCSVCGHTVENYQTNYCPNCGARMKG